MKWHSEGKNPRIFAQNVFICRVQECDWLESRLMRHIRDVYHINK